MGIQLLRCSSPYTCFLTLETKKKSYQQAWERVDNSMEEEKEIAVFVALHWCFALNGILLRGTYNRLFQASPHHNCFAFFL
jgi:hypothetical protein